MTVRPRHDDSELAVRYLSDKLSATEREAFEEQYLANPQVVEEMELDAKFKAGLISIRDSGELDRVTRVPRRVWSGAPFAIAASVLIAVIAVLAFRYFSPGAVLASSTAALRRPFGSEPVVATTHRLVQTRRNLYDAVIFLPKKSQAIRLQMAPDIEPPIPPLAVIMTAVADDGSRASLATLRELRADGNGIITLYLNAAAVTPGTYELAVAREGTPAETPESVFVLKVTADEGSPPPRSP